MALRISLGVSVAPFTGAWIEMRHGHAHHGGNHVAPFTGAWIEMLTKAIREGYLVPSLPSRERGLKWLCQQLFGKVKRRSLHGSVD